MQVAIRALLQACPRRFLRLMLTAICLLKHEKQRNKTLYLGSGYSSACKVFSTFTLAGHLYSTAQPRVFVNDVYLLQCSYICQLNTR